MNKKTNKQTNKKADAPKKNAAQVHEIAAYKHVKEIKPQESPLERALKIASEEVIALAIRDMIRKDCLN